MSSPMERSTHTLSLRAWFTTIFILFFGRGLMYTAWATRGPDIRDYLGVSLGEMGILAMFFAAGAIAGVIVAGPIINRWGSRVVAVTSFIAMPLLLASMVLVASTGNTGVTMGLAILFGLPFGAGDFVSNVEAGNLDRASEKSRMPMLHGGYSIGVLLGAAATSGLIGLGVDPITHLVGVSVIFGALTIWRAFTVPRDNGKLAHHLDDTVAAPTAKAPINVPRIVKISLVAFIFVLAEGAAAIFIPLALVDAGRSSAEAAVTYTLFSLGMAVMRVVGGWIVDRIGRIRVVLYSSLVAAAGIAMFVFTPSLPLENIAAVLWGAGNSLAIAMTVSAVTDNPVTSNRLQSILWTFVYVANLGVGPLLGGIANITGIFVAFWLPVVLMIGAAFLSRELKRDPALDEAGRH